MEKKVRESYLAPEVEVLKMNPEGIVCASPGKFNGFGDEHIKAWHMLEDKGFYSILANLRIANPNISGNEE